MSKPGNPTNEGDISRLSPENTTLIADISVKPSPSSGAVPTKNDITDLVQSLALPRVMQLCKKFCYHNREQYQCTLDYSWGNSGNNTALCDWGNATYAWVLDELTHPNRLEKVAGEEHNIVTRYFTKIIYSIAFVERFKNWRFQRRIRVPEYIKALDPDAHRIFWFLCDQDEAANIAQRLGRQEEDVQNIIREINAELHKRKRSHILSLTEIVSLTSVSMGDDDCQVADIPTEDTSVEDNQNTSSIRTAWAQLSWLEQYVIDALVVDGLKAASVLTSLIQQGVSVDERIKPEDQNVQHLYYFYRKTLAKLKDISGLDQH